jgi:hypothetical protein
MFGDVAWASVLLIATVKAPIVMTTPGPTAAAVTLDLVPIPRTFGSLEFTSDLRSVSGGIQ